MPNTPHIASEDAKHKQPPPDNVENVPPNDPPPPVDPGFQPPPPPPPIEPIRSESDSSDDDDGVQPWHPIQEDASSPDEAELKEIEESPEHSALDHEYWEGKAFLPLEEPEYTAGASGRIHWNIDAYNGTREKPNREIVMKSEAVTIGGHQWQIKFYPKGNDSDYLSVYLECLSVMNKNTKENEEKANENFNNQEPAPEAEASEGGMKDKEAVVAEEQTPQEPELASTSIEPQASDSPVENQHTPLPLLGSKTMPKRKSVAAQVSVVLYNPTEPRVHYSRTALHRFCGGSPDWGWTRFHGPYYDIAHRMRGQRQALLRDDKLAFTAYIRVVEDDTNCLWEHHSRENKWDSFAMTGLQSLILGEDASAPGGNMISAVASWLLFKPFRTLLYSIDMPDPDKDPFFRPKPLLCAMQKVLFMLRTQVDPGAGPVALDDVLDALEWYHIHDRLHKLDVIEVWEVLRAKLEEELQDTPQAAELHTLLGPKRDYSSTLPTYRVPVIGVETMQEAVNKSKNFVLLNRPLPQLLSIELERQEFDVKTRSYVKLMNKVSLDDHLTIGNASYTLYGFVVHKQTLQSYVYQPILRPEGPGSRWYSYSDSKDENQVKCLTKRQAIDDHEGKPGKEKVIGNDPVAYIAMYVRDDIAQTTFKSDVDTEKWEVPEWVRAEVEKDKENNVLPPMPPLPPATDLEGESIPETGKTQDNDEPPTMLDFKVIDSRLFKNHEGPGIFDAYDSKCNQSDSEHIHTMQLPSKAALSDVADKIAALFPEVKDKRQVLFWFLDPLEGSYCRPQLLGTGKVMYSRGCYDRFTENKERTLEDSPFACRRIWVYIIDFADLPELPTVEEKQIEQEVASEPVQSEQMHVESNSAQVESAPPPPPPPPEVIPHVEDTPMSEPDEPVIVSSELPTVESQPPIPPSNVGDTDTPMVEVEAAQVPDPPAVDVLVQDTPAPGDTEMGGTQDVLPPPPPPPPPVYIPVEPTHPPPPQRARSPEPAPEEIYFFLKLWNPENQSLESRGSHVVLKSARVDETVTSLLGLPMEDKKKIELWEEEELTTTRPIKHRRSFSQLDLRNAAIIITALPQTPEQRSALAARAAFADPQPYLIFRAFARNFPYMLNGHFTYNYFSDQYYKGEIKNGHRHGQGYQIYHSGATFEGSFRLGHRHGHGLYTFQNGDTYDGDWVDNQQHGTGTFIEAATGNTYTGGWKNDKKFGEGVTHWKNAQEAERMCRICWDEAADAAFYDCGHVVACLGCAREVQNCPLCRKRVLSAMKLYYVA